MEHNQNLTARLREAGITYQEGEPLASHTTFKIGGPAAVFVRPDGEAQLCQAVRLCRVISTAGMKGEASRQGDTLTAPAGMPLGVLCMAALHAGLTGLEFAYGIPGTVGGAVYMNAGAYGGEMKDVLVSVRYLTAEGTVEELPASQLELGYRHSVFETNGGCILAATVRLAPGDPDAIAAKMNELMGRRRDKQPLDKPSAGSTFKRPAGAFAGALIEQCGLRGHRCGGAAVSEKHCGFVVNLGGATCADVLALCDEVARTVKEQTGYTLEKEIRVVEL